jgi:hypothetical protein
MLSTNILFRASTLASILFVLVMFQSCSSNKTEQVSMQITAASEGPYFSGSNSFFSEYNVDLTTLISKKALKADNIKSVKLSKASIQSLEGAEVDFSQFSSASLQVVADNAPMTSIAILNPILENTSGAIALTVSEEAELTDVFKESSFTFLLDLDFKEDNYDDAMSISLNLELLVEYN